jgi:hypothetical protein
VIMSTGSFIAERRNNDYCYEWTMSTLERVFDFIKQGHSKIGTDRST